jgi:hypothetical protein
MSSTFCQHFFHLKRKSDLILDSSAIGPYISIYIKATVLSVCLFVRAVLGKFFQSLLVQKKNNSNLFVCLFVCFFLMGFVFLISVIVITQLTAGG